MFELLKKLIRKPSQPRRNSRGQACWFVPTLERLEARELLSGSPILSDASGHLFRLGSNHELYYSASGLGNDWRAIGGPYEAIAGDRLHDVFALGIDHKLYRCTASTATPTLTGVDTLLQSYHSNGAQVVTVLDNGAFQQSDDGVHFSTIGLGGTITQLAAGRDSEGRQVLLALRKDGELFVDSSTGVTQRLDNVQTLIQSYHSNGAPAVTLLAGGQFEQSDDGVNFSTIGLGGPLTQLAAGEDSAGQQVLFALRQDGVLFVDSSTGVKHPLANVQTLIQSYDRSGAPAVVLLAGGKFEDSHDGVNFSTIDFGGTITQIAAGQNSAGLQVLFALRKDGVLFVDSSQGVTHPLYNVQTLIQSYHGNMAPSVIVLDGSQLKQSDDGVNFSTIDLGGPLTQLAAGHDSKGWQVLFALRQDGVLFVDSPTGVTHPLYNVQTLIQSYHSNGAPVVILLAGGQLEQSDDGVGFSTIGLGGPLTQIAAGQDSEGRQVLFALRNDGDLFVDSATGVTQPLTNVQTLIQSYHSNGAPVVTLLDNGRLQQSDDGVSFSTIGLGGPLAQIAAGHDSKGWQVLFALREDGVLFVDSPTGVTQPLTNVQTLIQSYHSNGTPVVTLLDNGRLRQSDDGVNFSTINLGGPLVQIAAGKDSRGGQVLFALRNDGELFEDGRAGVLPLADGVTRLASADDGRALFILDSNGGVWYSVASQMGTWQLLATDGHGLAVGQDRQVYFLAGNTIYEATQVSGTSWKSVAVSTINIPPNSFMPNATLDSLLNLANDAVGLVSDALDIIDMLENPVQTMESAVDKILSAAGVSNQVEGAVNDGMDIVLTIVAAVSC